MDTNSTITQSSQQPLFTGVSPFPTESQSPKNPSSIQTQNFELMEKENTSQQLISKEFQPFSLGTAHQINLFSGAIGADTSSDEHSHQHHQLHPQQAADVMAGASPRSATALMHFRQRYNDPKWIQKQQEHSLLLYFFGFCVPCLWFANFVCCMKYRWRDPYARQNVYCSVILLSILVATIIFLLVAGIILTAVLTPLGVLGYLRK